MDNMEGKSCQNTLKCLYTNADSLTNKMDEFVARITTDEPDIIGITETVPKSCLEGSVMSSGFALPGYTLYSTLNGRGSALYIREGIKSVPLDVDIREGVVAVWCSIPLVHGDRLLVGLVYRSPSSGDNDNRKLFKTLTDALSRSYSHLLLMGDFNYPNINWDSMSSDAADTDSSHEFLEICKDGFLYQHVDKPTHYRGEQRPSILDLVLTNERDMIQDLEMSEPLGRSHHVVLRWTYTVYVRRQQSRVLKYNYDRADYDSIRSHLAAVDWTGDLDGGDVDGKWGVIVSHIMEAVQRYVPRKTFTGGSSRRKPEWLSDSVQNDIRDKKDAFDKFKKTRNSEDYKNYTKRRNKVKKEIRNSIKSIEKEIAKNSKHNPKLFYKYLNKKLKTTATLTNIKNKDGTVPETEKETADVLNDYFSSVFTRENLTNIPAVSKEYSQEQLSVLEFSVDDVRKQLKQLKQTKSPGPDQIHPRLLKECADQIALPLWILFRESIEAGVVPDGWKKANVTPVHKKGNTSSVENYRPISLTPVVSKVLEKLVRAALLDHLKTNGILSGNQHGFVPGRSCITQLLQVMDKWTEMIENGNPVDVIYLDFAKAFDSVPHRRMMVRLESVGVAGELLSWIEPFLVGRQQRVSVNGVMSDWAPVLSGIPQGSVLGPVLFVIFINDMPSSVKSLLYMYADDTKIFRPIRSTEDMEILQDDLNRLVEWSRKWQLKFNITKCKVMHMWSNKGTEYVMTGETGDLKLEVTSLEKDLGLWVDDKLNFREHINKVTTTRNDPESDYIQMCLHRKAALHGSCETSSGVRQCNMASSLQIPDQTVGGRTEESNEACS